MVEVSLPILLVRINDRSARHAYGSEQEWAHVMQNGTKGCEECKVLWSSVACACACARARTIKKRQQPSKEYHLISELISPQPLD